MSADAVGRVLGTDEATPLEFWVAVAPGHHLQLDDVVAADRILPNGETVSIYRIVGQVRARHEGARFDSDVFLIADGVLPAEVSEAAQVQVTRVVPETFVPPLPGSPVRKAVDAEREEALDLTDVDGKLPAGLTRDGEPVVLDLDFIDGTKGAHVNISGISGIATKTTYATFLLYSLFNSGVLGAAATNTKSLIFNVKGEDQLFLDHANTKLDEAQRSRYGLLGLEAAPFRSVRVLAPPRRGDPNATPATGARTTGVRPLYWTIAEFCAQGLLPFLFADAEDERQQYTIVVQAVAAQLRQHALAGDTRDGAVRIDGTTVRTFRDLVRIIESKLMPDDPDDDADPRWSGRAVGRGTINAFVRRLASAERHLEHLIRADLADAASHSIDLDANRSRWSTCTCCTTGPSASSSASCCARRSTPRRPRARRSRCSSWCSMSSTSTRRGTRRARSRMILIGAQQTASEVERRVVANSAVRVVGRLDSAEAGREQNGFLPAVQRQRATILKPGSMFVSQPRLPVPVLLEFPFPAWATRASEADLSQGRAVIGEVGDDPFAGLS